MTHPTEIQIITQSEGIESRLTPYRDIIGKDYDGYKGHLYRVLTYSLYFLNGDETHRDLIETALVYHDISLWTEKALAYLEPSSQRAIDDNKKHGWGHDPQLLHDIIYWHHKMWPYHGPNEAVVNAVRKADWIDATQGIIKMGMQKHLIQRVNNTIPAAGFHDTLKRLGPELSGGNILRMVGDLLKVYKI